MNLQKILDSNAKELEKEEVNILKGQRVKIVKIGPELVSIFDYFTAANEGGKKIRGLLIKFGFELAGGSGKGILKIAAAYEILHTSILAHDDIIDKSPTRRDRPSLYKSVGVEQAICLADYGFFLAMKIIAESKFEEKLKIKALSLFSKTMIETAIGQMMDVAKGDPATIMDLKTAKYTVCGPLQLGATLAGADEDLIIQLGVFGTSLGIAFQIKDDILDGEVKSVERAKIEASKHADKARSIIPKLTKKPKIKELLSEIVDYMVERSK